jgi:hypothetical protein
VEAGVMPWRFPHPRFRLGFHPQRSYAPLPVFDDGAFAAHAIPTARLDCITVSGNTVKPE